MPGRGLSGFRADPNRHFHTSDQHGAHASQPATSRKKRSSFFSITAGWRALVFAVAHGYLRDCRPGPSTRRGRRAYLSCASKPAAA